MKLSAPGGRQERTRSSKGVFWVNTAGIIEMGPFLGGIKKLQIYGKFDVFFA